VVEARRLVRRAVPPAALSSWAKRPRLIASFCSASATAARQREGAALLTTNKHATRQRKPPPTHAWLACGPGGGRVCEAQGQHARCHAQQQPEPAEADRRPDPLRAQVEAKRVGRRLAHCAGGGDTKPLA
jgi:hypothetical protein